MRKIALTAAVAATVLAAGAAPSFARSVTMYDGTPGPDSITYDEAQMMIGAPVRDLNGVHHGRVVNVDATPSTGLDAVVLRNGTVVSAQDVEYNKKNGWVIVTLPHSKLVPGY